VSVRGNGVLIGTVLDLKDPEKLGRVRLQLPQYADEPTDWARVASPMAGKDRGFFFQPEVGDEVLVAFENGDPRRAYVLGALWSKVDMPPKRDGKDADNNLRLIQSRSGHRVVLDDTKGAETIEITHKNGKNRIVITDQKIEVIGESGDMTISAPKGTLKIDAMTIDIKAKTTMSVDGGNSLTLKGSMVNIN
jgi:uncharacterized protein involved in type VI secretion and phage assembly